MSVCHTPVPSLVEFEGLRQGAVARHSGCYTTNGCHPDRTQSYLEHATSRPRRTQDLDISSLRCYA